MAIFQSRNNHNNWGFSTRVLETNPSTIGPKTNNRAQAQIKSITNPPGQGHRSYLEMDGSAGI
ncbi:MAG: hypothetical protein CMB16_00115 [Euryarchaeota archaeon]|nr:hypothetical protein [Euryarchaeota archaeon]